MQMLKMALELRAERVIVMIQVSDDEIWYSLSIPKYEILFGGVLIKTVYVSMQ